MTCFLTLYFDSATELAIEGLWQVLTDAGFAVPGVHGHRPHVTLAAYDTDESTPYRQLLEGFTRTQRAFSLRLHALGVFPEIGVVFLAPRVTTPLLALHTALLQACGVLGVAPLKYAHHLDEDLWTPHCTLARGQTAPQVASILTTCIEHWQGIEGMVEGIGLLIPPAVVDLVQYAFAPAVSDAS